MQQLKALALGFLHHECDSAKFAPMVDNLARIARPQTFSVLHEKSFFLRVDDAPNVSTQFRVEIQHAHLQLN
ncbi:hypothetical protein CFB35_17645 [Burkholderia sp. AU16482]|nr:hypothetical protein CFB35_17645 [Burkholderia sp. AU16482]